MTSFRAIDRRRITRLWDHGWADVCSYQVEGLAPGYDPAALFAALLAGRVFRDSYLIADSWRTETEDVHGPFRIARLRPEHFRSCSHAALAADLERVLNGVTWGDGSASRGPVADRVQREALREVLASLHHTEPYLLDVELSDPGLRHELSSVPRGRPRRPCRRRVASAGARIRLKEIGRQPDRSREAGCTVGSRSRRRRDRRTWSSPPPRDNRAPTAGDRPAARPPIVKAPQRRAARPTKRVAPAWASGSASLAAHHAPFSMVNPAALRVGQITSCPGSAASWRESRRRADQGDRMPVASPAKAVPRRRQPLSSSA